MSVRIITPPEPLVVPADIPGMEAGDTTRLLSLIAAATEEIDGPTGWLGRCLGPQLLEWTPDRWPCTVDVPYGPWLETESVKYIDPSGAEQTWAFPTPLHFADVPRYRGRRGDIRIQYWAGYGKRNEDDPTKWDVTVPERVKQAIIIAVQDLMRLSGSGSMIRSETVEDVGQRSYIDADRASAITRAAAERLLQGAKGLPAMSPAEAIGMLDRQIAAHGEALTVRRYTSASGTPRPKTDVSVNGHVRAVKADEIVGDIKATHSNVVLSPTGLSSLLPLVKGDKVVVQGRERNVELVKPILLNNVLVRINLVVAG